MQNARLNGPTDDVGLPLRSGQPCLAPGLPAAHGVRVVTITLYGIAASRTARPLWMLEELGVPYTRVAQPYLNQATRTAGFLALNPNGHVPVLDDDGVIVWESMAINLYLVRKFGGPLAPASLAEEAQALRWSFWVVTECERDALAMLFHRRLMPAARRNPATADQAERALARPFAVLDSQLSARPYLAGERFTVADLNVASVLAWTQAASDLPGRHPALDRWLRACLERPAQQRVQALVDAES